MPRRKKESLPEGPPSGNLFDRVAHALIGLAERKVQDSQTALSAAQQDLASALPSGVKPEQIVTLRAQQAETFNREALNTQNIAVQAAQVGSGLDLTRRSLADLEVTPEQTDSAIRQVLGLAVEAVATRAARKKPREKKAPPPIPTLYYPSQAMREAGFQSRTSKLVSTLINRGYLQPTYHFQLTPGNRRVITPEGVTVLEQVRSGLEKTDHIHATPAILRKIFGQEVVNPYGSNGPRVLNNDCAEFRLLYAIQEIIPTIESEIKPTTSKFKQELANRLGVLQDKLEMGPSADGIPPNRLRNFQTEGVDINIVPRQTAAALWELAYSGDTHIFNPLKKKRPGINLALIFIQGLSKEGKKGILDKVIEQIANPAPGYRVTADARNGFMNPKIEKPR